MALDILLLTSAPRIGTNLHESISTMVETRKARDSMDTVIKALISEDASDRAEHVYSKLRHNSAERMNKIAGIKGNKEIVKQIRAWADEQEPRLYLKKWLAEQSAERGNAKAKAKEKELSLIHI